jgi:hypothetical protein
MSPSSKDSDIQEAMMGRVCGYELEQQHYGGSYEDGTSFIYELWY